MPASGIAHAPDGFTCTQERAKHIHLENPLQLFEGQRFEPAKAFSDSSVVDQQRQLLALLIQHIEQGKYLLFAGDVQLHCLRLTACRNDGLDDSLGGGGVPGVCQDHVITEPPSFKAMAAPIPRLPPVTTASSAIKDLFYCR